MTRFLYVQTPDGVTHKRKTDRNYSHAVAYVNDAQVWRVLHYCGSLALAQKQCQTSNVQIFPVTEVKPEPTHIETARAAFLTAPAVEVVKPSLQFPEPTPGKTFTVSRRAHQFIIAVFIDGRHKDSFIRTKELTARVAIKRFLGLGYALTNDAAKIVSPLSSFNPQ